MPETSRKVENWQRYWV